MSETLQKRYSVIRHGRRMTVRPQRMRESEFARNFDQLHRAAESRVKRDDWSGARAMLAHADRLERLFLKLKREGRLVGQ